MSGVAFPIAPYADAGPPAEETASCTGPSTEGGLWRTLIGSTEGGRLPAAPEAAGISSPATSNGLSVAGRHLENLVAP